MAQIILLERVDNLGDLGEVVSVKPGYARNYLIPQNKALRATKANIAYFEAQKAEIEKQNETNKKTAQTEAKKIEGITVALIRLASEKGQLYGSVAARDIAEAIEEQSKIKIKRSAITIHEAFKTIGLFTVSVALHPEVKVDITLNIARTIDEAKIQEETGKALISDDFAPAEETAEEVAAADEEAKKDFLEEDALEAEKVKAVEDAEKAVEDAEKKAIKDAEKAAKKAVKEAEEAAEAAAVAAETEASEEAAAEEASTQEAEEETK